MQCNAMQYNTLFSDITSKSSAVQACSKYIRVFLKYKDFLSQPFTNELVESNSLFDDILE